MKFIYYDPEVLIPIFRERGIFLGGYEICYGCVFTRVLPEDCAHNINDFKAPSVQSDCFCPHCYVTIEESGERFELYLDKDLGRKIRELEKIIEMSGD